MKTQLLISGTLCAAFFSPLLYAGDLSTYRDFQFGMSVSAAAKKIRMKPSEVRLVHQRPALIQELDWQPRRLYSSAEQTDAVREGMLSFYNGELSRIVITYDRSRVEGLSADDMIETISATYGVPTRPSGKITYQLNYLEVASVLARWEDSEYSYNLVHSGDKSSFAMVLYSKRLDALANAATVEAARLDAQEAPQRELEAQELQQEEIRKVREKARAANKPNFRP